MDRTVRFDTVSAFIWAAVGVVDLLSVRRLGAVNRPLNANV